MDFKVYKVYTFFTNFILFLGAISGSYFLGHIITSITVITRIVSYKVCSKLLTFRSFMISILTKDLNDVSPKSFVINLLVDVVNQVSLSLGAT